MPQSDDYEALVRLLQRLQCEMKGLISHGAVGGPTHPPEVIAIFVMEGNANLVKDVIFFYPISWRF